MPRPDLFIGSPFKNLISKFETKGVENVVVDHFSRIPNAFHNELPINDDFPDE